MTTDEFNILVERAVNATTLSAWLRGRNQVEALAVWYGLLRHVELNAAVRVLDRIVAGEIDLPRDSWAYFPRVVLRETAPPAEKGRQTKPNVPTNRVRCRQCDARFSVAPQARRCPSCNKDDWEFELVCRDCGDLQIMLVWSPAAMDDARRLIVAEKPVDMRPAGKYVCGVPCHCSAPIGRRQFNPATMIPVEPADTAVDRLVEHVESLLFGRAGRRDDFAAWNAGGAANV